MSEAPWAWLASCSLAPRTDGVRAALRRLDDDAAQPDAWVRFEQQVTALRAEVADAIGARPEQVALASSASEAAYQAMSSLRGARPGRTLTSRAEFPSLVHVWERFSQVHGGGVVRADGPGPRTVSTGEAYLAASGAATDVDLVSVPMVAYDTGERLPVEEVVRLARSWGARTLVDAYQYLGTGPLDVEALGCDVLVGGTSKYLLGLPGLAFCYVREPDGLPFPPHLTGWQGRRDPFAFDHRLDFARGARRLEVGTPPVPSVYAALAGLRELAATSPQEVHAHRTRLTAAACDVLEDLGRPPVTPRDPARRGAHLAVPSPDATAEAAALVARGVVCAPRGGYLRLAFHVTNGPEDVDRLAGALVAGADHRSTVAKGAVTR